MAQDIYSIKIEDITGEPLKLSSYQGKVVLAVNIATQCGYTPQLEGLESLYQEYKDKGLVVLGLPSNDFGGQTPEANGEVKTFCKINYGVTFPLTDKITVKGEGKHPLIENLIKASGKSDEVAWNFEKFLIDRSGKVVGRYPSATKPQDSELVDKIKSLL